MRLLLHRLLDAWATALALFLLMGLAVGLLPGREAWTWMCFQGGVLPGPARAAIPWLVLGFAAGAIVRRPALVALHRACAGGLSCVALADVLGVLQAAGMSMGPRLGFPVPESLATMALLLAVVVRGPAPWPPGVPVRRGLLVAGAGGAALLVHVAVVGSTAHVAPGGPIVVLGARVYPDGTPSGVLEDRVASACDFFFSSDLKGNPLLVLSGGVDPDTGISEPEVMARLCRQRGIPAERILLDPQGYSTRASAASVLRLAKLYGWREVHVVSHAYHLARVQVAFHREGLVARVVPCRESFEWSGKPLALLREVPAILAYLVK